MGAISNPCGGGGADGRGARERERGGRERRGARAAERAQGRETASPMVLHCGVGEEVAATFGEPRIRPRGSLFVYSLYFCLKIQNYLHICVFFL